MKTQLKKEWASANEAHYMFGVNRAWLRERWNRGQGDIQRKAMTFTGVDGAAYTKFLYRVEDIERAIAKCKGEAEKESKNERW